MSNLDVNVNVNMQVNLSVNLNVNCNRELVKEEYLVIIMGYFFLFLHKNICCGTH